MRNFQKGSSANMLEAFQKKLDSLLEVEVESSTDIFSTVTVNDPLPDDYYVELSNALDEYFEFSNTYTAWNIQVEEDGIHILIVNLDATTDEYVIEYDEDIEYDIDADLDRIISELEDLRANKKDQKNFNTNRADIDKKVQQCDLSKYYQAAGAVPEKIKKAFYQDDNEWNPICRLQPKDEYKEKLDDAGYHDVYLAENSESELETFVFEDGELYYLTRDDLDWAGDDQINGATEITEDIYHKIDEISNRFYNEAAMSGDWSSETKKKFDAIKKECNLSDEQAMDIMIDYLGYDPDNLGEELSVTASFNYSGHPVDTQEYVVEYVDSTGEVRKELVAAPDDYAARNIIEEMLAGDGEVLSVDVATEEDKSKFYHQATQYEYEEDITVPFI